MKGIWAVSVIAGILIIGSLGLSQQAFAAQFIVNNQATCEGAPIFGTFDSGTCVLSGTHTIPLSPQTTWQFEIVSKVTGTVDVFGELQFRADHSNFGTINVIGDPGGAPNRGLMTFVFGTDYTNECSGIINLIGGDIGFRSGTLRVIGQDEFEPIFNNFGTINGIDSDLGEEIATVQLVSAPSIPVFNNHGTLTAPVIGNTFNDNLPNQCTPDLHPSILTEVQNIEEKLDGDRLSLITQISNDIVSMLTSIAQILGILQDPNFGLEEIKEEVSSIEENMNIGATKSLSVDVNGGSTFIIGAPDSEFPTPNVVITNPFDPPRDSNIKICVDATSFTGKVGSLVRLKLDVAGDGDFSVHSEAMGAEDQGPKKGVVDGKLKNVICREVAAKEFQLVIINNDVGIKNVEAAIIWNTGNKIIP